VLLSGHAKSAAFRRRLACRQPKEVIMPKSKHKIEAKKLGRIVPLKKK
jgi:hypothetical protein